jgi:peroxin-2
MKLFGYLVVQILLPYVFNRLSLKSQNWVALSPDNPRKKIWLLLTKVEIFWKYLSFLHFIYFLLSGKYVSLANQILGLRLVYASTGARHVSFDFMNRQLIWNGFSEFMFFIMPMLNVSRVKEFFRNFFQLQHWTGSSESGQDIDLLDKVSCGICGESPIVIPYTDKEGVCKHNYCYYCLQQKLLEGGNYFCPRDKTKIVAIKRVQ